MSPEAEMTGRRNDGTTERRNREQTPVPSLRRSVVPSFCHSLRDVRLVVAFVILAWARLARADGDVHAEFRLDGRPHAGVPFVLSLLVEGFDEQPAPDVPKLDIPGAKVTQAGPPQPNVSRSIQIVNGRRSDSVRVTWVVRWRIEADKEGALHVPSLTVAQGSKHVSATPGDISVDTVPTTDDMRVELGLPDRPIFIGESAKATLTWLFRRDPADRPQFAIPVMSLDEITVSAPPTTDKQHAIEIEAAGKTLELPYTVDQTTVDGQKYNRLTATFFLAPRKAGKLDMPPATVVAALAVGQADFFGNSRSKLFRATDVARTLEVRPLPEQDRPASFAGAVGSLFSLAVTASRSVVQLGEPVDLAIQVKSDQALDTLALARLDGEGGLPRDKFTVPQDPPTGELSDDGKVKTFKVTVQVAGPTNEIPALAFSYFDPKSRTYQTIHSDPIAPVGEERQRRRHERRRRCDADQEQAAGAGRRRPRARRRRRSRTINAGRDRRDAARGAGAVGVDRPALRAADRAARRAQLAAAHRRRSRGGRRGPRRATPRRAGARHREGKARARRRRRARRRGAQPRQGARPHAGRPGAREDRDRELRARFEATKPLPAALHRGDARARDARWLDDARRSKGKLPRAAVLLVLLAFGAPAIARAEPPAPRPTDALADGRAAYADAMKAASASGGARPRSRAPRSRSARPRAPSRDIPSSSPTGATPRSAPATSRSRRSRTGARSRSIPTTRARATTSRGYAIARATSTSSRPPAPATPCSSSTAGRARAG